jgi:5'-nucleotidase
VLVERVQSDHDRWPEFGVHGPPAFIVRAAVYGAFGPPPDVVLSGINRGRNTGRAVLHSGTVGAALTAATYGRRALAISAEMDDTDPDWGPAESVATESVRILMASPTATTLNVNIPHTSGRPVLGLRATRLAAAGAVQGSVTDRDGAMTPVTFSEGEPDHDEETDAALLAAGYASLTAIRPVCEDESFDLAALLPRP